MSGRRQGHWMSYTTRSGVRERYVRGTAGGDWQDDANLLQILPNTCDFCAYDGNVTFRLASGKRGCTDCVASILVVIATVELR